MRGWIAMAFGNGENPYADAASIEYAYDEDSPNHKQISAGDLLFIRNRHTLEAIGRIDHIEESQIEKVFQQCPRCQTTKMVARKTRKPVYRCDHGHTFDEPQESRRSLTTYTARLGGHALVLRKQIAIPELYAFELRGTRQLSLMPVDIDALCLYVARREPRIAFELSRLIMPRWTSIGDLEADDLPTYIPPGFDGRERIAKLIRFRRGYAGFREKLLERYDSHCVITGCRVLALLEAAHIRPYQGPGDNHPANGLLLRSDLHTLFDMNRIAVNPENLTVTLHPDLADSEYNAFAGTPLLVKPKAAPDHRALQMRWHEFTRRHVPAREPD